MLRALRPTGNRILARADLPLVLPISDRYQIHWLNSGTAALALAISMAKSNHRLSEPEVILPAYGCPDLVAAAKYAGVKAVLVDVQAESPLYEPQQLAAAISDNTIAIVAATLLGMRADEFTLREAIGTRSIALIEDSAQWFPRNTLQPFFGDSIVLSFGRGKPINLLGGGALLTSHDKSYPTEYVAPVAATKAATIKHYARVCAYNTLIRPSVYGLAEKIPFLHIGETAYHDLPHITAMAASQKQLLPTNLRAYQRNDLGVQKHWRNAFADLGDERIVDLTRLHAVPEDYALLRYPLLIQSAALRNQLYTRLRLHGLGASIMYARPLVAIPGLSDKAKLLSTSSNAAAFADRLLTLPTHDAVTADTVANTLTIFRDALRSSKMQNR